MFCKVCWRFVRGGEIVSCLPRGGLVNVDELGVGSERRTRILIRVTPPVCTCTPHLRSGPRGSRGLLGFSGGSRSSALIKLVQVALRLSSTRGTRGTHGLRHTSIVERYGGCGSKRKRVIDRTKATPGIDCVVRLGGALAEAAGEPQQDLARSLRHGRKGFGIYTAVSSLA